MTYVGVTANVQASRNADKRVLLHMERAVKERSNPREQILGPDEDGQIKVHGSGNSYRSIIDSPLNSAEMMTHILSLKVERDELIKLMDNGYIVGSRKTYHKCGGGLG